MLNSTKWVVALFFIIELSLSSALAGRITEISLNPENGILTVQIIYDGQIKDHELMPLWSPCSLEPELDQDGTYTPNQIWGRTMRLIDDHWNDDANQPSDLVHTLTYSFASDPQCTAKDIGTLTVFYGNSHKTWVAPKPSNLTVITRPIKIQVKKAKLEIRI